MNKGLFIVIEGSDGSGKGTQHKLLTERLKAAKWPLLVVDFPQYGQPSAELVEIYLNNGFGDATELDPRLSATLFAIDRLAAKKKIESALQKGMLVLANRFTASNMAHQGSKMPTSQERVAFFRWLHNLEHTIMGIPEPNYHFVLHVPARIAQERVLKKAKRNYTSKKLDGHEANLDYLTKTEQTYVDLVKTFPNNFTLVDCMKGNKELSPQEIHEHIWQQLQELKK